LGSLRAASPAKSPSGDNKKEKKKRVHDPNAPKRPLTPYFLYMQTARPIIAGDLGPEVAKGAVSAEGVRRWNAMIAPDKQLWTNAYTDNLRLYNARMHSYKSGNFTAKDMSDEDALVYADTNNIGVHTDLSAEAQLLMEDAPGDADEGNSTTTPKTKGGRKSKGGAVKATPVQEPAAIVSPPAAPVTTEKEKSPDKKRKRAGKKVDEPVESIEKEAAVAAAAAAPPAKKSRKKKGET